MRWLALVLFAGLPLQWFGLGSSPVGVVRLHQVVIFGFAAVLFCCYRMRAHAPVLRTASWFVVGNLYLLGTWAIMDVYNGNAPIGGLQQLMYLVAFVLLGTYFFRVAADPDHEAVAVLRWAAPVTCLSLLVAFSVAMAANGVHALEAFGTSVGTVDPQVVQLDVFRASFSGFGLDEARVHGTFRHEIFASVLFSMLVSTWAIRSGDPATRLERTAYRVSMVTGTVLIVVSLSRSLLIAAVMWPLIALVGALASRRLTRTHIVAVSAAALGFATLLLSGWGAVLWSRITEETTSYEARATNYAEAVKALPDHWLTGGFQTAGLDVSTHNFVLDSWLRGGIFTGIAAGVILLLLVVLWVRLIISLPRQPALMLPVTVAVALPVVRMVTAGGGLIPPVEWVVLAFVFGVLAARARPTADRPTTAVPVTHSAAAS